MLIGSCLYADFTISEIYQWTDTEGNVHFGDKPKDTEQVRDATPVVLKEGYRPPQRTAKEMEDYQSAQQASAAKSRKRQSLVRDADIQIFVVVLRGRKRDVSQPCEVQTPLAARGRQTARVPH